MYIQTSNKTADTLEVCISGEMDAANCAKHKDDFNDIIDGITVDRVEMNLEGISFLDSSGIGIIVQAPEGARPRDGHHPCLRTADGADAVTQDRQCDRCRIHR